MTLQSSQRQPHDERIGVGLILEEIVCKVQVVAAESHNDEVENLVCPSRVNHSRINLVGEPCSCIGRDTEEEAIGPICLRSTHSIPDEETAGRVVDSILITTEIRHIALRVEVSPIRTAIRRASGIPISRVKDDLILQRNTRFIDKTRRCGARWYLES